MTSVVDTVNQNQHFKSHIKRNLRENIFQLVQKSEFGLNVSQISNILGLSRNTIKNHLAILEQEGRIRVQELGRSKVILVNSRNEGTVVMNTRKVDLWQKFWANLVLAMDEMEANMGDGKEESFAKSLGRTMEPSFVVTPAWMVDDYSVKQLPENPIPFLKDLVTQFNQIISTLGFEISIEIVPQFKDSSRSVMVRVQNHDMPQSESMYQICIGLLEAKLQRLINPGLYLHFREADQAHQCFYLEVTYEREKNQCKS